MLGRASRQPELCDNQAAPGNTFTPLAGTSSVSHEYKRHGTTTLFAALNVLTGSVRGMHAQRRRRREFLAFMNEVVADYPGQEIHVVLDNLNTHKLKHDRWLARHPNVHFHFTPTHASWLNQVETWFSILSRQALRLSSFRSPREVRDRIDAFIRGYNAPPIPSAGAPRECIRSTPLHRSRTYVSGL